MGEREGERGGGQRKRLTQALKSVTQPKFENIKRDSWFKTNAFY